MTVALLGLGFMYLVSLSVIASLSLRILYSAAALIGWGWWDDR